MRIEYYKSTKNRQWYWRIKAANGQIILSSEGYKRRMTMLKTIKRFIAINWQIAAIKQV